MILSEELIGNELKFILEIWLRRELVVTCPNQELIEKIFVNLILAQINDVSINLFRGVCFLMKFCHKNRIIF
jgi:hypothetical protein